LSETPMSELLETARETIQREIEALRAAGERLGAEFERAVDLIAAAPGKVIVTGLGKSGIAARKIAATLCSTGTPAVFVHPVEALHGDCGLVQSGDVAVLLSKSGETAETLSFWRSIRSVGCPTIAVVGRIDSRLAKCCDAAVDAGVEREACPLNLAPTSSALVAVALGDALAACLLRRGNFTPDAFGRLHPSGSLGNRLLLRVRDVMHRDDELPLVGPEASMKEAVVTLSAKAMGAVIVGSPERELLGILTDGDLRRAIEKHDHVLQMRIGELMTTTPVAVFDHQMAAEAVELMENRHSQIAVLPVINEGRKVVGIVRIHDLVKAGL